MGRRDKKTINVHRRKRKSTMERQDHKDEHTINVHLNEPNSTQRKRGGCKNEQAMNVHLEKPNPAQKKQRVVSTNEQWMSDVRNQEKERKS